MPAEAAQAGPFLVSDPTARTDITHCGVYEGTKARVLSPVAKDTAGKPYCRHDIATWAPGTYTVTATFVIAGTPEQESAKSVPYTFTIQPALTPPSGLRLGEVALGGGEIVAQVLDVPPGQVVDLSAVGALDWRHWGMTEAAMVNAKAGGGTQIAPLRSLGGGTSHRWYATGTQRRFAWSDGTPTAVATDVVGHIDNNPPDQAAPGQGWETDVPAGPEPRTLVLYLRGHKSQGRVEAALSDGSAPGYSQVLGDLAGDYQAEVRLTYRARADGLSAQAGQKLVVRWTQESPAGGNIHWSAAALL